MRALAAVVLAVTLCGCRSTSATVWEFGEAERPRDLVQPIEVVQDPGGMLYRTLGHVRAGGNVNAYDAMERLKQEARVLGAHALTNVHRVTGTDEAIYEADAIQWIGW
ncbi:MAG: hypothetical protein IT460_00255 [Planctomycetes bacterium]|nr:hypothetical protein [Planctomycetota bacterium]